MNHHTFFTRMLSSLALTLALNTSNVTASTTIDNINGSATPPFLAWGGNYAGWVYTPNFSYNLDGIYSTFENVGSTTQQGPVERRTVTLSVFDKKPSGTLLAKTTFVADGAGGNLGGNFPPILLLANHDYFIAYENIYNIGLNIPNWIPNQAIGTVNLNGWYTETNWQKYYPKLIDGVLQVFSAPILRFEGTKVSLLPNSADCLFAWAEKNYPQLLPTGATSQTTATYYYRYYKNTNSYVGISSADNHVYYLAANGNIQDLGNFTNWLATAGCN